MTAAIAACGLSGCVVTELSIAMGIAGAAAKAGADYYEKTKPTPEQAWTKKELDAQEARALRGDVDAQYAVALRYLALERPETVRFACLAANQGHPGAQVRLGHWYNEDRLREDPWPFLELEPDDRRAYVWYGLAAGNGDPVAPTLQERLASRGMTAEDLSQAESEIAGWQPARCKTTTPEPGVVATTSGG